MSPNIAVQAIDWQGSLSSTLDTVIAFVPKLLMFLVVLVIGWIIAKVVSKLVATVLDKVGFDRVLERAGVTQYFSGSFGPIELLAKIIYYWILLVALQLALQAFGPNPLTDIINQIFAWLPQLIVAIVIVIIVMAIANAVYEVLSNALSSASYGSMVAKAAQVAIIGFGLIAALNQIGIAVSVTNSVMIAILATLSGVLIVGVGGGLIGPMRQRWEGWLQQAQAEAKSGRGEHQSSGSESAYAGSTASSGQGYSDSGSSTQY